MSSFLHALIDFSSLLLFPFLGVMTLLRRRALAYLVGAILVWVGVGAIFFWARPRMGPSEQRYLHAWLVGIALGAAFLAVAWLKDRRKISRWLKLTMAAITLVVFCRALYEFFHLYA